MVREQIPFLESEWKALLYGGVSSYAATSQFPMSCPATSFTNAAHSYLYYQTDQCLRNDQSTCLKPDDKFYQVCGSLTMLHKHDVAVLSAVSAYKWSLS